MFPEKLIVKRQWE